MEDYGTHLTCNQKRTGDMINKKQCATTLPIFENFCLETVFMINAGLTDCTLIFKTK